jgi:acyl carrier protein
MNRSAQEIRDWIAVRLSRVLNQPQDQIDVHLPLIRFGLDSVATVALISDLETWLGFRFRSNPLTDQPTIASLAEYLAQCAATEALRSRRPEGDR